MTDLVKLKLAVDSKQVDKASKSVKKLKGETSKTEKGIKKFTAIMKKAAIAVAIAAIIIKTIDALAKLGAEAIAAGDAIGKTSAKLGITAEALQELRIRADAASVTTSALEVGFQRFTRRLDEARGGSGKLAQVFKELNIDLRDQNGRVKSNEEVFKEFGDAVGQVDDASKAIAMTFAAVDTEGVNLINMFRQSAAEQKRLTEQAKSYGRILDSEVIAKMEEYQTQLGLIDAGTERSMILAKSSLAPLTIWWAEIKNSIAGAVSEWMIFRNMIEVGPETKLEVLKNELQEVREEIEFLAKAEFRIPLPFTDYGIVTDPAAPQRQEEVLILERIRYQEKLLAEQKAQAAIDEELARGKANLSALAAFKAAKIAADETLRKAREEYQLKVDRKNIQKEINDSFKEHVAILEEAIQLEEERVELNKENLQKWKDYVDPVSDYRNQLIEISLLMKEFPADAERLREAWLQVAEEMNKVGDKEKGPLRALLDDYQNLTTQAELFKVEGIEKVSDALSELAVTGTLDFKKFAVELLSWVVKMIIKMTILKAIMTALGSTTSTPATATPTPTLGLGGPPVDSGGIGKAGQAYMIGVGAQPEMFIPQTNGQFVPIQQQGGGSSITINGLNVVVQERKGESSTEQAAKIGRAVKEELRGLIHTEMIDARRPGNIYNPAGAF